MVARLRDAGIRVSLFIEADPRQLDAAVALGAPVVELHTGRYCEIEGEAQKAELVRIEKAAAYCAKVGLECHAGHGLNYENVAPIAAIPNVRELNIGHFLIGEAIFVGLKDAIREMRRLMDEARAPLHVAAPNARGSAA
jgi:pyridoxine 5-phosphate synthase